MKIFQKRAKLSLQVKYYETEVEFSIMKYAIIPLHKVALTMKLLKALLVVLFLTNSYWASAQVHEAYDSKLINLNVYSDSTISIPKDHVWMIDTIVIESTTSSSIYLDSKEFSPSSRFPILIEHKIALDSLTGNVQIHGRELRISKENYPLLMPDER